MNKRNEMIKKSVAVCLSLALMTGCNAGKTTEQSSTGNSHEKQTQAEKTTERGFVIEDYQTNQQGLYDISELVTDLDTFVGASYSANDVLFVKEEKEANSYKRTISKLSLITGEEEILASDNTELPEEDFGVHPGKYKMVNSSPLIIYDNYHGEIWAYSDDLSNVIKIKSSTILDGQVCFSMKDGCLYYQLGTTQKVFMSSLQELRDYCTKKNVSEVLLDGFAHKVWQPQKGMEYFSFSRISPDGNVLEASAWETLTDKYLTLNYQIDNGGCTAHMSSEEYFPMWNNIDNSAAFFVDSDSPTACYTYCDYITNKSYTYDSGNPVNEAEGSIILDTADSYVSDGNVLMPFYDIEKSGIEQLLLWDIGKAQGQPVNAEDSAYKKNIKEVTLTTNSDKSQIAKAVKKLEDKYGIYIFTGKEVGDVVPDYTSKLNIDESKTLKCLNAIDEALAIYPEGFIEEISNKYIAGITFYINGALVPIDSTTTISAAAVTFESGGRQCIAMDIGMEDIKYNCIHEMSHVIDNTVNAMGKLENLDKLWKKCNPKGFKYSKDYLNYLGNNEYTSLDDLYWSNNDPERVYFYDDYAKTFPTEDRARTMEYFSKYPDLDLCYESSHMRKKVKTYLDFMKKNFRSFSDSKDYLWNVNYEKMLEN